VKKDGTLAPGKVLFDGSEESKGRPGVADSLKVDVYGNIFIQFSEEKIFQ